MLFAFFLGTFRHLFQEGLGSRGEERSKILRGKSILPERCLDLRCRILFRLILLSCSNYSVKNRGVDLLHARLEFHGIIDFTHGMSLLNPVRIRSGDWMPLRRIPGHVPALPDMRHGQPQLQA